VIVVRTKSADDTQALGAEVGNLARPGDVVVLIGELGTGKTVFVKGMAKALGVADTVISPTFMLVRTYDGRLPLVHADAYRIDQPEEAVDLALTELLDEGAVAVIEWGERLANILPANFLEIRLELGATDDERVLRVRSVGNAWAGRIAPLQRCLDPWASRG
jgi:tRNA threonylcarbamoyladenosine biosynthesis protein TsaE